VRLTEEMEKEIAQTNQLKEKELKELYNTLARDKDESFIREFFAAAESQRNEKMKSRLSKWTANDTESFDDYWEKFKKEMLSKQEN
ncbi:MAG TPA: hypothetical protein VF623_11520, partial [Segetibacter sp.]